MKKIILSTLLAGTVLSFSSCSDSDQAEPWIQWYPLITLEGDASCQVEVGSDWTLPGFSAVNTLTGEDATSAVKVLIYDVINGEYVSDISLDGPGMYTVYYMSDGSEVATYPSVEVTRAVYVYDPTVTTDIAGTWMVDVNNSRRVRYSGSNAGQNYTFQEVADANGNDISDGIPVVISKVLPGFFYVDDIEAGLVTMLYGYAAAYPSLNFQMHAYISMNAEGELTFLTGTFGYSYWQSYYEVTGFEGSYDEETGTISYTADLGYYGFYLDVVLEPEE